MMFDLIEVYKCIIYDEKNTHISLTRQTLS